MPNRLKNNNQPKNINFNSKIEGLKLYYKYLKANRIKQGIYQINLMERSI